MASASILRALLPLGQCGPVHVAGVQGALATGRLEALGDEVNR